MAVESVGESCPGHRTCPAPLQSDAILTRRDDAHIDVEISGWLFCFKREGRPYGGRWQQGPIVALRAGLLVDELWLQRARALAGRLVAREIRGAPPRASADVLECGECGAKLYGDLPANTSPIVGVSCGPEHVIEWGDGAQVAVAPGGEVHVLAAPRAREL